MGPLHNKPPHWAGGTRTVTVKGLREHGKPAIISTGRSREERAGFPDEDEVRTEKGVKIPTGVGRSRNRGRGPDSAPSRLSHNPALARWLCVFPEHPYQAGPCATGDTGDKAGPTQPWGTRQGRPRVVWVRGQRGLPGGGVLW